VTITPTDRHRTREELDAGFAHLAAAPADNGTLELIVRRPAIDEREILEEGHLTLVEGLAGDNWLAKPSSSSPDGNAHPEKQLTVMNARCIALLAGDDPNAWALAGDQLYVDLDIGVDNLPAGTRLRIGDAVIEITEPPHTGCVKFSARFGVEAPRFVNSPEGKALRLRGANAKVITPGTIRRGDAVTKVVA
jgi:MOSC domain-containing protein YiiM